MTRQMMPRNHPTHQSPEQLRAPTDEGELLESLGRADAPEGKTPVGGAHGHPPDSHDPQTHGSTIWSQNLSIRRPVSARIRRRGLFSTRVPVCTLVRGPARMSSSLIWTSISGQHHCSKGSKTLTHHVWAASSMLHNQPQFSSFSPFPPSDTLARQFA